MNLKIIFLFLCITGMSAQDTIVNTGSNWFYYDGANLLLESWKTNPINEQLWKKGKSPLGYHIKGVKTIIDFGEDEKNKPIRSYFIKDIMIKDPTDFLIYELLLRRDDGAVIYLNGYEVWRSNMPQGKIEDFTESLNTISGNNERLYHSKLIPNKVFLKGINRLCIVIFQRSPKTSDCIFDLKVIGHNDAKYFGNLIQSQEEENVLLESKLKELSVTQELKNKENDYKLLEQVNTSYRYSWYGLIAFLFLSYLVGFWWFKKVQNKTKQLTKQLEDMEKQKEAANRVILNNSLFSLKSNQYLEEIKISLKHLLEKDEISQLEIKKIIRNIENNLDSEEEWQKLESHFNVVHTKFVDRLKSKYPSLTTTELRHCIFIKLLMSTKEIAKLMNIGPRSVQATRYRIKKKLNLTEKEDLKDFIGNI